MLGGGRPTPLLPKAKEVGGGHMPGLGELRQPELRLDHSREQHPAQKQTPPQVPDPPCTTWMDT